MTTDRLVRAVAELAAALREDVLQDVAATASNGHDRLLSVDDAADALGVGRTALYDMLAAGQLRSLKVGRRRLVPSSALSDYIAQAADGGRAT